MLLTNRTVIQKEVDEKFDKYKQITKKIMDEKKKLNEDYISYCEQIKQRILDNEKQANNHIAILRKTLQEEKERGCAEYANLLVSLYNHQYVGNADDN